MNGIPTIKIELDHMRHQIVHAFESRNQEIEEAIDRQLQAAIDNYPFESEISRITREVLSRAIEEALDFYFRYGKGKEIIKKAVVERLDKLYD